MPSSCRWLLALHSSGDGLGVAVQALGEPGAPPRLARFDRGRALSGALLDCVESVLPADQWPQLGRLAVATGPGGFTSTRLTVVMARTLAQQLQIPLDGVSSFLLMVPRLAPPDVDRFWLCQALARRGTVAGLYGIDPAKDAAAERAVEHRAPRLFPPEEPLPAGVHCAISHDPEADCLELLRRSQGAAAGGLEAPWPLVLPHYPTSPVEAP
jgi:tRNA threonylcarbamoyl adenosine modification protein YeaZ